MPNSQDVQLAIGRLHDWCNRIIKYDVVQLRRDELGKDFSFAELEPTFVAAHELYSKLDVVDYAAGPFRQLNDASNGAEALAAACASIAAFDTKTHSDPLGVRNALANQLIRMGHRVERGGAAGDISFSRES